MYIKMTEWLTLVESQPIKAWLQLGEFVFDTALLFSYTHDSVPGKLAVIPRQRKGAQLCGEFLWGQLESGKLKAES